MKNKIIFLLGLLFIVSCNSRKSNLLYESKNVLILSDSVKWSDYSAKIRSKDEIASSYGDLTWKRSHDLSKYPQFSSDIVLLDAMYNMSLDELEQLKTAEGYFNTGALWGGVWTRDYSESIILSLASIVPDIAKKALLKKTKNGFIIQDTGTGGSWPVSTDRMIWTVAAWEVFNVTGDKQWLDTAFSIIRKSTERDRQIAYANNGLMHGETTTMDWRENSYPSWMQPIDIFESFSLSTNAVHYKTYMVLGEMAKRLNRPFKQYFKRAEDLRNAINKNFWIDSLGYYGEFIYGRNNRFLCDRSDAVGEAFCILFDIASPQQKSSIMRRTPVVEYGIPLFYPYKPDAFAYHNNSVWPYVQAVWNLAAAQCENEEVLSHGLAAIYRLAAIFASNKENFVAVTGDALGTAVNSDRQLWSVAGNLSMTYKVFFGMQFGPDSLFFKPAIPKEYKGEKQLTNFVYRKAVLDISVSGFGSKIKSFIVDGKESKNHALPGKISGKHDVRIIMCGNDFSGNMFFPAENKIAPEEPELQQNWFYGLYWNRRAEDKLYNVYENGKLMSSQADAVYKFTRDDRYREIQVEVVSRTGLKSFLSKPFIWCPDTLKTKVEIEDFTTPSYLDLKNFSGKGYVETSITNNTNIPLKVTLKKSGKYLVSIRYSNGNGQMCCTDKCAVRSLLLDDKSAGAFVFPIIENEAWSKWGESNTLVLDLKEGTHNFNIVYTEQDENMNVLENRAMLDYMKLVRISE